MLQYNLKEDANRCMEQEYNLHEDIILCTMCNAGLMFDVTKAKVVRLFHMHAIFSEDTCFRFNNTSFMQTLYLKCTVTLHNLGSLFSIGQA